MAYITVNTQNVKITAEPPERPLTGFKSVQTADEIVASYSEMSCLRQSGSLPGTAHLEVEQSATLVVAPPLCVPVSLKEKLKEELDGLQQLKVISPIREPTPWVGSLAVAVTKSGALRICIDPRLPNTALKRERYQPPVLDDMFPELSKTTVSLTVDLKLPYPRYSRSSSASKPV